MVLVIITGSRDEYQIGLDIFVQAHEFFQDLLTVFGELAHFKIIEHEFAGVHTEPADGVLAFILKGMVVEVVGQ